MEQKKNSTDLLLVVSQQLPPWGGVVHAGDPIICQLLPDVEYFLGVVVGQLATIPLGGVKQCEQPTLITAKMGKKICHIKLKPNKGNALCATTYVLLCNCLCSTATHYVPLCNYLRATLQLAR